MTEGLLHKRFQEIANHIPLGILDELSLRERHSIMIPSDFNMVVEEMKADFPMWGNVNFVKLAHDEKTKNAITFYALRELKLLRKEWFEKWLGTAEKEPTK